MCRFWRLGGRVLEPTPQQILKDGCTLLLWYKQWSLSLKCQKQIHGDLARKLQFKGEVKELPFYLKPSP